MRMKTLGRPPKQTEEEKRLSIYDSAFRCIMQYGYAKTSLEDIAKGADISRSSLYQLFENKEDLVRQMGDHIMSAKLAAIEASDNKKFAIKKRVMAFFETWFIDLYSELRSSPHASEILEIGDKVMSDIKMQKNHEFIELLSGVVKDKPLAEVLLYASIGLRTDLPSVTDYRKRMKLLIEKVIK